MPHPDQTPTRRFQADLVELRPCLLRKARRLCNDADLADDLVQETMLRAIDKQSHFQPGTNLRAWTFTILRNLFYTNWHREKRFVAWDEWLDETFIIWGGQEEAVALSHVAATLHAMPEAHRSAIALVAVGGCSYEEAAHLEQCALGTMKSRVSRARASLADRKPCTSLNPGQSGMDAVMALCTDRLRRGPASHQILAKTEAD